MTRFLAVIRRLFLAGTVSLALTLFLFGIEFSEIVSLATSLSGEKSYFSIFYLASPILFIVLLVVSVKYIRHHGQFAATHQTHSPIVTFFQCLGHDILSPFKNITGFIGALKNKNALGRGILVLRFIELAVIVSLCALGIILLIK